MRGLAKRCWLVVSVLATGIIFTLSSGIAYAFTPVPVAYPTTSPYITGLASGPDGNMWYTSRDGGAVGKLTPSGTVTEYNPPSSDDTPDIVAGPDGNMWFVEYNTNKVGKITTSGVITEYTVPTLGAALYKIVAGPDGNLWFIENEGNKVGKITTSGVITEYTIPTANSNPQGIAVGPDGNLWFTETTGRKIGKITTSGVITEYSLGSESPMDILAGPDGNLWFTSYGSHIGKITTSGSYTLYNTSATTSGIAVGPDNLVWFTLVSGPNNIGHVSMDGTVTEYALAGDPYTLDMTRGADDNLYFAVYAPAGQVLKLTFPAKPGLPSTKNVTVVAGKSAHIDVLSGISGNPDPATLTIVKPPSHGTAVVNTITYTPNAGFTGTDTLTYRVCSSEYNLICAQTVMNINVVADLPNAPNAGYAAIDGSRSNVSHLVVLAAGFFVASATVRRYCRKHVSQTK